MAGPHPIGQPRNDKAFGSQLIKVSRSDIFQREYSREHLTVPFNPDIAGYLGLPPAPYPGSKEVRVNQEFPGDGFVCFDEPSIPIDHRSYIFYGDMILPRGTKILSQFVINTKTPTLLVGSGRWYIRGNWFSSFEPEALELLGVDVGESRPFSWTPNVPIQTIEQPPYLEGVPLHSLMPLASAAALPRAVSGEKVGGGWLTSLELEVDEPKKRTWSCKARRPGSVADGVLFLTPRRVLFCSHLFDRLRGVRPFAVRGRELNDVACKPVADSRSGDRKTMALRLVLVGGHEELFLVDDLVEAMVKFSKKIRPFG